MITEPVTTTWHEARYIERPRGEAIVLLDGRFGMSVDIAVWDADTESWYNDCNDDITDDVIMWTDIPRV